MFGISNIAGNSFLARTVTCSPQPLAAVQKKSHLNMPAYRTKTLIDSSSLPSQARKVLGPM
jgi:hypothetical protein